MSTAISASNPSDAALRRRMREILELHFDDDLGTPYWLDRAGTLGFDPRDRVRDIHDLHLLGEMRPQDLAVRPLCDYIPRCFHAQLDQFIVGQTGGTTGGGVWTAYRVDEFHEAFVLPFLAAAEALNFPRGEPWLYVGPTGPHLIGKAASRLARGMGSAEPFSVDFDPRWARKLPDDSFAAERYLQHVIDQAMAVIASQPISVLFTTPRVLAALSSAMTKAQRHRIRAVHYGGMALESDVLQWFQTQTFPHALHISGYGNTLLGCALELNAAPGRHLDYFPYGDRLIFDVVDATPRARICATRLDRSMLIVRLVERDEGQLIVPPVGAPAGFSGAGLRDPRPFKHDEPHLKTGLY